jgi:hypothetical protein
VLAAADDHAWLRAPVGRDGGQGRGSRLDHKGHDIVAAYLSEKLSDYHPVYLALYGQRVVI